MIKLKDGNLFYRECWRKMSSGHVLISNFYILTYSFQNIDNSKDELRMCIIFQMKFVFQKKSVYIPEGIVCKRCRLSRFNSHTKWNFLPLEFNSNIKTEWLKFKVHTSGFNSSSNSFNHRMVQSANSKQP